METLPTSQDAAVSGHDELEIATSWVVGGVPVVFPDALDAPVPATFDDRQQDGQLLTALCEYPDDDVGPTTLYGIGEDGAGDALGAKLPGGAAKSIRSSHSAALDPVRTPLRGRSPLAQVMQEQRASIAEISSWRSGLAGTRSRVMRTRLAQEVSLALLVILPLLWPHSLRLDRRKAHGHSSVSWHIVLRKRGVARRKRAHCKVCGQACAAR
jgi:hypothetical protein